MINKKLLLIQLMFLGIVVFVSAFSLRIDKEAAKPLQMKLKKSYEVTRFDNINYFKTQGKLPYLSLVADELEIIDGSELNFIKPNGSIINGSRTVYYQANAGNYLQNTKILSLRGEVSLKENKSNYKSSVLTFDGENDIVIAAGDVESNFYDPKTKDTLRLKSDRLRSDLMAQKTTLFGEVEGSITRLRRYEQGLKFNASKVVLNSLKSQVLLTDKVKIQRNNFNIGAGNAEIFLENYNKKLKYYSLYDDVKFVERINTNSSGATVVRRAFAEKLEAFQNLDKIVLTGAPRVEQGKDIIKGYQITLRENVELVEVDDSQTSFSLEKDEQ